MCYPSTQIRYYYCFSMYFSFLISTSSKTNRFDVFNPGFDRSTCFHMFRKYKETKLKVEVILLVNPYMSSGPKRYVACPFPLRNDNIWHAATRLHFHHWCEKLLRFSYIAKSEDNIFILAKGSIFQGEAFFCVWAYIMYGRLRAFLYCSNKFGLCDREL